MIRGRLVRYGVLATVALVAALALACGGDDETPTATATPTATVEATEEPTPEVAWPALATATVLTEDLNVRTGPGTQHVILGRLQPEDEVPVSGRDPSGRWLGLTGIGWVAYDEEWVELTMPRDDLPLIPLDDTFAFVGPLHDTSVSSDLPVVDQVVNAIVQGDRGTILNLVDAPEDGEGGSTESERPAPSQSCPDSVRPASQLEEDIDAFLTSEIVEGAGLRLYAVIGRPGGEDVDPQFVVVLAFEGGEGRQMWLAADGSGIQWYSLGCGPTPPGDLLQLSRDEPFFWFRPVAPPPLTPVG